MTNDYATEHQTEEIIKLDAVDLDVQRVERRLAHGGFGGGGTGGGSGGDGWW